MGRILLVNPPSSVAVYAKSKIKVAIGQRPLVSLVALGAMLLKEKQEVNIIDLIFFENPKEVLLDKIKSYNPDFVGFTFTTPLFNEVKELAKSVREEFPSVKLISGGVHSSIMPEDVLRETVIDIVVIGEGDYTLPEIVRGKELSDIKGIVYKDGYKIKNNSRRELIKNLDELPFPAWSLYDIERYKNPRITAKKNPVGTIETSRGCVYGCSYCNKSVFTRLFRYKSPERVVEEMKHMIDIGFGEIHVWDDNFATNLARAKKICDLIVEKGYKINWRLECGVRADCVDLEFFQKAKQSGCYGVSFGYESGNDGILKGINKGETCEQFFNATKWAKHAGLEITGFFMLGLPGETEKTMIDTFNFAKKLDPEYVKFTILVPFPSTPIFEDFEKKGLIKTKDWSRYNFHTASRVYDHPNLSWEVLEKYYNNFHKDFYFRPSYLAKRVIKGVKTGDLFYDVYYGFKTFFT